MKPLASRKQLLLAESELNRAQLIQEWQTMSGEVHALARQAKSVGSFAAVITSLVAGLAVLRHQKPAPAAAEPAAWWQTLLKGAGVVGSLWLGLRSRGRNQDES